MREALEVDFLALGLDLSDVYTGHMSLRRFRVAVKGLPTDSRAARLSKERVRLSGAKSGPVKRIEDEPADVWTQDQWLMVYLHDELRRLNHAYAMVHRDPKKAAPSKEPTYLPRPGGTAPRRRTLNAWFGALGLPPLDKPVTST